MITKNNKKNLKGLVSQHSKNRGAGFTILETIVAISILSMAITATFSAAQTGLSSAVEARDQVSAFYLAQEAVEMIRNIRDENSLEGENWLSGISQNSSDPCFFGNACAVDAITKAWTRCSGGGCDFLRQDRTTSSDTYGFYGYNSSWSQTVFKRTITLESISADEISLTVRMDWSKGINQKQFEVKETIFNWQ